MILSCRLPCETKCDDLFKPIKPCPGVVRVLCPHLECICDEPHGYVRLTEDVNSPCVPINQCPNFPYDRNKKYLFY